MDHFLWGSHGRAEDTIVLSAVSELNLNLHPAIVGAETQTQSRERERVEGREERRAREPEVCPPAAQSCVSCRGLWCLAQPTSLGSRSDSSVPLL